VKDYIVDNLSESYNALICEQGDVCNDRCNQCLDLNRSSDGECEVGLEKVNKCFEKEVDEENVVNMTLDLVYCIADSVKMVRSDALSEIIACHVVDA